MSSVRALCTYFDTWQIGAERRLDTPTSHLGDADVNPQQELRVRPWRPEAETGALLISKEEDEDWWRQGLTLTPPHLTSTSATFAQ
jgi:hypothetical protein